MNKNNTNSFMGGLYSEIKKSNWKIFYEEESDSLFWTKKPFPVADKLAKASKEISFYLNNDGVIDGLVIQPFQSNFLSHNEEVSGIAKLFSDEGQDGIFTIPQSKNKDNELVFAVLSATIQKDIYKDAAEANYPVKKLEEFLTCLVR